MEIKFDGEEGINFLMVVACCLTLLAFVHFVRGCEVERTRIKAETEIALKKSNN